MKRIVGKYLKLSSTVRNVLRSFISAIVFFGSALISGRAVEFFVISEAFWVGVAYVAVFLFVLFVVFLFNQLWISQIEAYENDERQEREALYMAYTLCDRVVTDEIEVIDEVMISGKEYGLTALGDPLNVIKKIIGSTYQTFESLYGRGDSPSRKINFEVTFMTKSYVDGHIIIPASANEENRRPTSMELRADNPEIYDSTITAAVYRQIRPAIQIIENTSGESALYEELYVGQRKRIASSIVYPILSDKNLLLGTLVVHCDKKNFFLKDKEKYWIRLLEIFAKRIAAEKIRLDKLMELEMSSTECQVKICGFRTLF